jgi:hypothetical protein
MFTRKMFIGMVVTSFLLVTVGAGYSSAMRRPTRLASVQASADVYLSQEIVVSALDNNKYSPAVAYNSNHDQYLVVWENVWPGGHHDIYAQRISSTGQLLSWFAVSVNTNKQMQPSVAYDPLRDRYLVTWIYDVWGNGTDWDVYGRFIPWNGPDSGLTDFMICNWNSGQWHPKVAYGLAQDEFLVVWMNSASSVPTYISGRRIFADGSGFPSNGFTISSGPENRDFPSVAYNLARNEYLVTWDVVKASLDIYGLRMTGTGIALGGGEFSIAGWPDNEEHPSVAACNQADQYLVTWQSLVTPPNDTDIYGRYIGGDGSLAGVYLVDGTTAPEKESEVTCNQGGGQYLITWQTMYTDGYYGIWGRRAFPDESMEDSFGLVASGNNADRAYPAAAGGKANYLVAWEHQRDGTSYQDIHGLLVTPYKVFLPFIRRN